MAQNTNGTTPQNAWNWLFSNYYLIFIALFLIIPFGIYRSWGDTTSMCVTLGLAVLIATISTVAAVRDYKSLVSTGEIKKFGDK